MKPSKVLIVLGSMYPYASATPAIMYRIADELHDRYGVEIRLLGQMTERGAAAKYPSWYLTDRYHYYNVIPYGLPSQKEHLLRLILHPSCWLFRLRLQFLRYPDWMEYRKVLHRALREEPDIDCVICSQCPHDTAYAAARSDLRIPLFTYKMDPWGTHYRCRDNPGYLRDEQWTDDRSAAVFVTPEIYKVYQNGICRMPTERVIPVDFPNLIPPDRTKQVTLGEDGIHCAFVGSFYPDIRSPEFLFELFRKLEDSGIVLHIIGNTIREEQAYRPRLPSNIKLHGQVSKEEADAFMNAADILVNVGNSIDNQIPSKIVDYIARGKPILNLCKLPYCPTLRYTEKYPLALNLQESDGLSRETVERVDAFCRDKRTIPFEQVRALYPECTPEYVGRQVYETLCRFLEQSGPGAGRTSSGDGKNGRGHRLRTRY